MKYLEWIINTRASRRPFPTPRIICNDGAELSVQAGEHLYCTPRNAYGPWDKVEIGFPSHTPPDNWEEYYDGEWKTPLQKFFTTPWKFHLGRSMISYYEGFFSKLSAWFRNIKRQLKSINAPIGCDSVYGYIPVELVKEYIESHGGENTKASFEQKENVIYQSMFDNTFGGTKL